MKIKEKLPCLLAAFLLGVCACASAGGKDGLTEEERDMLALINDARAQEHYCGDEYMPAVPPLHWNAKLARSAQNHATDMAEKHYFNHNGLDGKTPAERVKAAGYTGWGGWENIFVGYRGESDAALAMETWMNSPGHCKNLMNPEITEVGMASALSHARDNPNYWVQNFGMDLQTFRREKPGYILP